MAKKEIDTDRRYFNSKTGDKVFSHYTDGTEIALSAEDKKKAELASAQNTRDSIAWVEANPAAAKKPLKKRGRPPKVEEDIQKK